MRDARWIRSARKQCGLSQSDLGRRLGVGQAQISRWERGLALPGEDVVQSLKRALDPRSAQPSRRVLAADKLLSFRDQMGRVPDRVIAKESGVSVRTILAYRRREGIPPYDRHRDARRSNGGMHSLTMGSSGGATVRAVQVAPPVRSAPSFSQMAWMVTFGPGATEQRIVVASDLASAAARVQASLPGQLVRQIECLGAVVS
jgi:DNA-binding XRE family transcriptional regulator